jgi:hypothetical protein
VSREPIELVLLVMLGVTAIWHLRIVADNFPRFGNRATVRLLLVLLGLVLAGFVMGGCSMEIADLTPPQKPGDTTRYRWIGGGNDAQGERYLLDYCAHGTPLKPGITLTAPINCATVTARLNNLGGTYDPYLSRLDSLGQQLGEQLYNARVQRSLQRNTDHVMGRW